jgi:hypothetical protein
MADLGDPENWLPGKARLDVIRAAIAAYNEERPAIARAQTWRVLLIMGGFAAVLLGAGLAALMARNSTILGVVLSAGFLGGFSSTFGISPENRSKPTSKVFGAACFPSFSDSFRISAMPTARRRTS